MSVGIFEVLAADQSDTRLASRKALVLSRDRIDARLGKFLGASRSPQEFDARYDLVSEDFVGIVRVAAREVGHDNPDSLVETLRAHYADKEHWIQDAVKKPGDLHKKLDVPEGEKIPEEKIEHAEETGGKNLKEKAQFAENVKKGKKDKKKDKGKPPWLKDDDDGDDDDDDELSFEAHASDAVPLVGRTAADVDEDDSSDKSREKLPSGEGGDGNTGLSGPSPKMDKQRWTPKSVQPIDVPSKRHPTEQIDAMKPLPRKNEGPPGDIDNIKGIGEQTTERVELPSGKGLDDAGFNSDENTGDSGPTKTWGTDGREADPVRSESLEA